MTVYWKTLFNVIVETMMTGLLVLCCAEILKKDIRQMSPFQVLSATAFIGFSVLFVMRTWKGKEVT